MTIMHHHLKFPVFKLIHLNVLKWDFEPEVFRGISVLWHWSKLITKVNSWIVTISFNEKLGPRGIPYKVLNVHNDSDNILKHFSLNFSNCISTCSV